MFQTQRGMQMTQTQGRNQTTQEQGRNVAGFGFRGNARPPNRL